MSKIDFTKLSRDDLFYYFTNDHPDKDYSSVVALLQFVFHDLDELGSFMDRVVNENKTLVVVYPAIEDVDTSELEFIGEVPDGALYLK